MYETLLKREHTTLFHLYDINRKRIHGVKFKLLFDTECVVWWDLDRNFG